MARTICILLIPLVAADAFAGRVADHVKEIQRRADEDRDDDGDDRPTPAPDDGRRGDGVLGVAIDALFDSGGSDEPVEWGPLRTELSVGAGSVFGAQGAFHARAALATDILMLSLSNQAYSEGDFDHAMSQWNVMGGLVYGARENVESRFLFGYSGLMVPGVALNGARMGFETLIHARDHVQVRADIFGLLYEHEVAGVTMSATVRAYFFEVGYRFFDLNTGPPLHGPTVGVRFSL